jgi:ABC-type sugar transport system ATPase subunit
MVFQHNALYPHLTVEKFIRLGIAGEIPESDWQTRFQQAIDLTRIEGLLGRYPDQLSGGELRRAALAKAIVRQSPVRLLDEPLSALDASTRYSLQEDIARWHRAVPGTTVHVTHDGDEAMRMADRIAVLIGGRILQFDRPDIIYRRPACLAVARVIGAPPINLFPASVQRGQLVLRDDRIRPRIDGLEQVPDGEVWLGVRPESFQAFSAQDRASFPDTEPGLEVEAKLIEIRPGIEFRHVRAELDGKTINAVLPTADQAIAIQSEATICLRADRSELHLFEASSGNRLLG